MAHWGWAYCRSQSRLDWFCRLPSSYSVTFTIFDDANNGYEQWTESQTVLFNNGYYSVVLGTDEENNPLDDAVFSQYPLFLELKVDGEALSPRQPITSVPYAQMAGVAEVAESVEGGSVNAFGTSYNMMSTKWLIYPSLISWSMS